MSENITKAKAYIGELIKTRADYVKDAPSRIAKIYTGNDKRPKPDYFRESSYLYIRSYNGDTGVRPFSDITFWRSPDINISPVSNIGSYTTELEGGKSYNIRCRLHNRGDLMIPYPKVEFFLTDPTLGFNTAVAKLLGLTQLQSLLLPASNKELNFNYNVPASEAGHKCLFARTYSFSPLDKPFDLHALDPRIDRHVAQKNLNIIPQATPYFFNLVHQLNAHETIEFRPLSKDAVMGLQHPALQDVKITTLNRKDLLSRIKIEPVEKTDHKISLKRNKGTWHVMAKGKGPSLEQQSAINKRTYGILKNVHASKGSFQSYRKELKAFNEMNRYVGVTGFHMTIPDFGTRKGYAVGFEIVNTNTLDGIVKGGITIVALGK